MSEFPFQRFIDLVAFDQSINKLERDGVRLEQEVTNCKGEVDKVKSELDQFKQRLVMSKKEVDLKELEMKQLDARQKEKQRSLDRVANQREYQSLYQEIENLKKAQHDFEESLLSTWHQFEIINREYANKKQNSEIKTIELQKQLESYNLQQKDIKNKLEEYQQERSKKEFGIPEEWLEKYAIMRKSMTNPVVPVINGACSACFYNVPQKDIAALRRHVMLQCKDCYRFLYLE